MSDTSQGNGREETSIVPPNTDVPPFELALAAVVFVFVFVVAAAADADSSEFVFDVHFDSVLHTDVVAPPPSSIPCSS